jgi:hypothetical protein
MNETEARQQNQAAEMPQIVPQIVSTPIKKQHGGKTSRSWQEAGSIEAIGGPPDSRYCRRSIERN